jgi:hypothetical protein
MNKKIKSIILSLTFVFVLLILIIPAVSNAQCTTSEGDSSSTFCSEEAAKTVPQKECTQNSDLDKGLVQCGRKIKCEYEIKKNPDGTFSQVTAKDKDGKDIKKIIRIADPDNSCKFSDLITLVNNIINFILFYLAVPIAAIMFVYAGILLLFSAGDTGARTKAKGIFLHAVIGLVLAFAAFLIVKLLFSILGYTGADWIGF